MIFSRDMQWQFLEEELKAEVKEFDDKLKTSATYLMEKGEVFTAQFLSFSESGEMRVRFSCKRPVPRRGEYLYCMTLHKELRDHRNWGDRTYGDLVKDKTNFTEAICNWLMPSNDPGFIIAGFIGIDVEFAEWIRDAAMTVLVMGPNKPLFDYMAHLQSLTRCLDSSAVLSVLDADYVTSTWKPTLLNNKKDIPEFLHAQLSLNDSLILQGPPGTGKTYQIAKLCANLLEKGHSILVTALTNRALMEIAKKPFLEPYLKDKKVFKTKITTDEEREVPRLQLEKVVTPKKGCLVLSTFFITSGVAAELSTDAPFDFVIVDEASQALLQMIAAAKRLGKKSLFVGDVKQLPPVIQMKGSKVQENGYVHLVEGLNSITEMSLYPTYQLTESRRLTERGTRYTGKFYDDSLVSMSEHKGAESYGNFFLNSQGGPTLLKTDMELGELAAPSAMDLALAVVASIHKSCKSREVAVLACMKETVRGLQKKLNSNLKKSNLIVDTVARVQGLTTDICVYVVPNTHYLRSLDPRLFNVATSRARYQTIIIADKEILGYSKMDNQVKDYLERLDEEFSFYLPYNNKLQLPFRNIVNSQIDDNQFKFHLDGKLAPKELIYVASEEDKELTDFFEKNPEVLEGWGKMIGYHIIYLPLLMRRLAETDVMRYRAPYLKDAEMKSLAVGNDFMLQYLDNPNDKKRIKQGFIRTEDIHRGDDGKDKAINRFYPLSSKSGEPINDQLHRIGKQIAEEKTQRNLLENKGSSETLDEWGDVVSTDIPAEDKFNSQKEGENIEDLMEEVKERILKLRQRGVAEYILEQLIHPDDRLSRLVITKDYRVLLPDYNDMEIKMEPLVKAVYLLFLKHQEGIMFKYLPDYREELMQIYVKLKPNGMNDRTLQSIEDVTNPLLNSINEKCARIRGAFVGQFDDHMARHYYIDGSRGEAKKIALPRDLVVWE